MEKNEVAVSNNDGLFGALTAMGASASLVKRVAKAAANFALMETPKIPRITAGTTGLLLDASNPDEEEVKELTGVIIFGAKQKVFYKEVYDASKKLPPDCFSHGAKVPDSSVEHPQHPTCKGCPQNEFETAATGKGKACRDLRRLFLLMSVDAGSEAIMPMQLNITPTSLKAFDDYLSKLVTYGYSLEDVETKITARKKSAQDKYVVLSFTKGRVFSEDNPAEAQILKNIQALKMAWLPHMEKQEISGEDLHEETAAPEKAAQPSGEF
jgi:hypothetical protein